MDVGIRLMKNNKNTIFIKIYKGHKIEVSDDRLRTEDTQDTEEKKLLDYSWVNASVRKSRSSIMRREYREKKETVNLGTFCC